MSTFQSNPIIVTTTMASSYQTTLGAVAGNKIPIYVTRVYWYSPATAGDTFVIQDGKGNLILQGKCETASFHQDFAIPRTPWADFQVTTLASGTLYIYY